VNNNDKNIIQITFGINLRKFRLAKGYTQEKLANELGIEISQISRIERGLIKTSITTLYLISKILDTDLNDFFINDSDSNSECQS
jgi:transcriptional regulator with XRE-family HTH domain